MDLHRIEKSGVVYDRCYLWKDKICKAHAHGTFKTYKRTTGLKHKRVNKTIVHYFDILESNKIE